MSELDGIKKELERRVDANHRPLSVTLIAAHAILLAEERAAARIKRQLPVFQERGAVKPDHIGDANKMMPDPRAASPLLPLLLDGEGRPTRELARLIVRALSGDAETRKKAMNDGKWWAEIRSLIPPNEVQGTMAVTVAILDAWHGVGGEK
jgi:hypothetical protein